MGAYRAWMLSALSDDISVGCAICWMITTSDQLTMKHGRKENGGFANCIPMHQVLNPFRVIPLDSHRTKVIARLELALL